MRDILNDILSQAGVQASFVFGGEGRLMGFHGNSIYTEQLLSEVSVSLSSALDALGLIDEAWQSATVRFGDGFLILRQFGDNGGGEGGTPERHVLAVVADPSLNRSFVNVALRVAVQRLQKRLEATDPPQPIDTGSLPSFPTAASPAPAPPGTTSSAALPPAALAIESSRMMPAASTPPTLDPFAAKLTTDLVSPMHPAVAASSLTWSGSSSPTATPIAVASIAAQDFLADLTEDLARFVGPMAKVFVKECVRAHCMDRPFDIHDGSAVEEAVRQRIEAADDRAHFEEVRGKTSR
ncbi:MAG: hypothetical protein AAFU79_20010 [Myxococcota bacterium]